jgi:hypothetical protein
MSDIELQKLLDFDEGDLAVNRNGKLSPKQEKRLKEAELISTSFFIGTGIVSILIAIVTVYIVISNEMKQGLSFSMASQNDIFKMIGVIGIPGFMLGFLAWGSFRIAANNADRTVKRVKGRVSFIKTEKMFSEKKPNGSSSYRIVEGYQLRVGNVNFENLDAKIFTVLHECDIYAFYYTMETKEILSAEFIAKGK